MAKINPESQIKLSKVNIAKILKAYNFNFESFALPKTGIANTTAIVVTNKGKYALRIYRQNRKSKVKIHEEIKFALFLKNHGIPIPAVMQNKEGLLVHREKIDGKVWNCVLMEFIAGKTDTNYSFRLLKQLAATQAKMHLIGNIFAKNQSKLPKPELELKEHFFIKRINLKKVTSLEGLGFLSRAKKFSFRLSRNLPMGYNHMDIGYGNILVHNHNLVAILDFDDLVYGPIVTCLAYALCDVLYFTQDKKKVKAYLAYYLKIRKLNALEIRNIIKILQFRNYVVGSFTAMFWGERDMKNYINTEQIIENLKISDLT